MARLTRREICGLAVGAALAGCLAEFSPEPESENGSNPGSGSSPTSTVGDGSPGGCPEMREDVERVVCYDELDDGEEDLYLEPDADRVSPGEPIAFELANRTDRTLEINFYDWSIHKFVDGEWFHVAPRGTLQPLMAIPPGESHVWTVTMDASGVESGRSVGPTSATEEVTIDGVGAGTYAFATDGWFEGDGPESKIGFAATFELDGESIPLTATDSIAETEWEGETLVARSDRGDPDAERWRRAAFELERIEDPDGEPTRMIVEQVLREEPLRDALALSHEYDAEQVRLEEYVASTPPFGAHVEGVFEFQGEFYRVETRELDG